MSDLAGGGYIERAEPIVLIGEAGTGKTHVAISQCVAACRQRRRVRFTTAAALINELVEARAENQLSRALERWERVGVACIDALGYVPLADVGAELMFQAIADRAEKAALSVTTNRPFSESGQVFPNPRLCKGGARSCHRSRTSSKAAIRPIASAPPWPNAGRNMNEVLRSTLAPAGPQARRGPPPSAMKTRRRSPLPMDCRDELLRTAKKWVIGYSAANPWEVGQSLSAKWAMVR